MSTCALSMDLLDLMHHKYHTEYQNVLLNLKEAISTSTHYPLVTVSNAKYGKFYHWNANIVPISRNQIRENI